MTHLGTVRDAGYRTGAASPRPHCLAVLAAMVATPLPLLIWLSPPSLVLPTFAALSLAGAALAALIAWGTRAERSSDGITPWDIAGAFALVGFAAGMISEPEAIVQLLGLATKAQ